MSCPQCLSCQATKCVPTCTQTLRLGTITGAAANDYWAFFANNTTGKTIRIAVDPTSNNIDVDLTQLPDGFLNSNSEYEVWLTLRSAGINSNQDITIGAAAYECFSVMFIDIFDEQDHKVEYLSHTLEIDT